MLNSKSVSEDKHDPTGPVWAIVSKSGANLRSILIKQKTKYGMRPRSYLVDRCCNLSHCTAWL